MARLNFPIEFSPALQRYMDLPRGSYTTPQRTRVAPHETMLTGFNRTGKTNSSSRIPVIGTTALNPCTGIILYNPKGQKRFAEGGIAPGRPENHDPAVAVVGHKTDMDGEDFRKFLAMVRTSDAEEVEVHVVGAPRHRRDHDSNWIAVLSLNSLADEMAKTPNITVKTFDVYDKPKPEEIALDARNGRLFRGTGFARYMKAEDDIPPSLFYDADWRNRAEGDFDGTQPEYQLPPQARPRRR